MTLICFHEIILSRVSTLLGSSFPPALPLSVEMVRQGFSSFSATAVAKTGVVLSQTVAKTLSLEAEVSRLRHHVSVISRRLHLCEKERDALREVAPAASRSDSPFLGTDDDVLPPSEFEGVAGGVAVVRLPSPGVEAVYSVASSVASSRSGGLLSVAQVRGVRRKGRHSSLALGSSPPPSGQVVGEVDSDEDFVMESTTPSPEEARRAEAVARQRLRTSRRLETLAEGRREAGVEMMVARDGLSTPAPEMMMVLAEGKSSRYVSWGARRVPDVEMIGGRPVAAPHLCPVGRNAHGAVLVRCPCGGVVSRREVSRHAGGRLGRTGGAHVLRLDPWWRHGVRL